MTKPTMSKVRSALAQTISNALPELFVYSTLDEITQLPAVLIEPEIADFEVTMNNGDHIWYFNIWVMVPRTEPTLTAAALDAYIDGWGDHSVRKAIEDNDDLGLEVDAEVYGMKDYGGQFQSSGIRHLGAVLLVRVHI